jgi:type VI secretion system protein VasD
MVERQPMKAARRTAPPGSRVLGLVSALGVYACSSAPPPQPKQAAKPCVVHSPTLAISASEQTNAAPSGEGRPVQVRIYQLKTDLRLRNAAFEDIWQKDKEVLADDLVSVAEQTLYPGETKTVPLKTRPEAQKVAAVALFREPQGKDWFVSYELPPPRTKPPCPEAGPRISVWLDRMQIQDGEGRTPDAAGASAGSEPRGD